MLGFEIPVYNSRLQAFRTREGERRQTESDEILREIFVVLHSGSEITSPGSSLQPVRLQLVTYRAHPPGSVERGVNEAIHAGAADSRRRSVRTQIGIFPQIP